MCSPTVHVPFGGSTKGASQSWCTARHQGGSRSVALGQLLFKYLGRILMAEADRLRCCVSRPCMWSECNSIRKQINSEMNNHYLVEILRGAIYYHGEFVAQQPNTTSTSRTSWNPLELAVCILMSRQQRLHANFRTRRNARL